MLACLLQACASNGQVADLPPFLEQQRIHELELAILALDESVDRSEAHRAATIAIEYPLELARDYDVTDAPLVHNMKVNIGVKERGLCTDWTSDLLARLREEQFFTLDLHWGIANYQSTFAIEHSTAIISARGQGMEKGLVLDPWRQAGHLYWAKTAEDPDYRWYPKADIHALKREQQAELTNRSIVR